MASERAGHARVVTQQIHYTIEAREAEYELLPLGLDQGLGTMVWSPLAAGLLTGKHRRGRPVPEGSRQAAGWTEPPIRDVERLWDIVEVLVDVGRAHGVSAAQVALAWLLTRPTVASLVVGGRTEAQFADSLAAVNLRLTPDDLTRLNAVSKPPLIYPYWHQGQFTRARMSAADMVLHDGNEPPAW
jgi:aryl-alcohol dehydrogenase-like predicted oxidoreductase